MEKQIIEKGNFEAEEVSRILFTNIDRALDEAAARIKARAKQDNSVIIKIPYTRVFNVAENACVVRAKLRTVYNMLFTGNKVSTEQINLIYEEFSECEKLINEIAHCAVLESNE